MGKFGMDMDEFSIDDGRCEIDGFMCVESMTIEECNSKVMTVKADKYYIYLPMIDRTESGTWAYYLKIDKRLFQIGEVQR